MTRMIRKVALLTGPNGRTIADGRPIDLNLGCVKEFTDDEYAVYEQARQALHTFEKDRHLWAVVCFNCMDFELFLDRVFDQWVHHDPTFEARKASLEIDRRILNFVSSFGAWIDHLKYRYRRRYGRQSVRTLRLLEILSDDYFPYRFVLKYRNHVLHCGQPISNLELNSKMIDGKRTKMEFDMPVTLKKADLVEGRGTELEDMKDWPDEIDVRLVLRDAIEWAQKMNSEELQKDIREVEEASRLILELAKCWEGQVGNPCVFEYDYDELLRLKRMPVNTLQEIPVRCAEMVMNLKTEEAE
jgi:hypothetical protein